MYLLLPLFLQLAGNFVKNTRKPAIYITPPDIKVSMSADPVSLKIVLSMHMWGRPGYEARHAAIFT